MYQLCSLLNTKTNVPRFEATIASSFASMSAFCLNVSTTVSPPRTPPRSRSTADALTPPSSDRTAKNTTSPSSTSTRASTLSLAGTVASVIPSHAPPDPIAPTGFVCSFGHPPTHPPLHRHAPPMKLGTVSSARCFAKGHLATSPVLASAAPHTATFALVLELSASLTSDQIAPKTYGTLISTARSRSCG